MSRHFLLLLLALVACVRAAPYAVDMDEKDDEQCQALLTESVPQGMPLHPALTTGEAWIALINASNVSIDITSFYWTLTGGDAKFGGDIGEAVMGALVVAANRGVKIRIVQSVPTSGFPDNDTQTLVKAGLAEVRNLNMTQFYGGGILHSKFWVFDDNALWIGSANMDWRSLSQVKELGVQVTGCVTLAQDLKKLFETNWEAADLQVLPKAWPRKLDTTYDLSHPADVTLNASPASIYFASSPKEFCASGRTFDLDAIVTAILTARRSVSIEVMDYLPASVFQKHNVFWPNIDDAIRRAAFENGVQVRLLIGNWTNSDPQMFPFLRSLNDVSAGCKPGSVTVKLYNVPADPAGVVPYTRVNHAKFMVTDVDAYIGTSNWQADYFMTTGGASFNAKQPQFVQSLQDVFDRDWNSPYTSDL